jgi:hypothetical protein
MGGELHFSGVTQFKIVFLWEKSYSRRRESKNLWTLFKNCSLYQMRSGWLKGKRKVNELNKVPKARSHIVLCLFTLRVVVSGAPVWAADAPVKEGEAQGGSLTEVNKQLSNPISSLWSIAFQQNNYMLDMGAGQPDHWNSNLNFQPVLPVALTSNWNLMTRPVMTLFYSVPHPDPHQPGDIDRTTGFGDTVLMEMFSPSQKLVGNWLLGLGPTFIFLTASSDYTGQGKWRLGRLDF